MHQCNSLIHVATQTIEKRMCDVGVQCNLLLAGNDDDNLACDHKDDTRSSVSETTELRSDETFSVENLSQMETRYWRSKLCTLYIHEHLLLVHQTHTQIQQVKSSTLYLRKHLCHYSRLVLCHQPTPSVTKFTMGTFISITQECENCEIKNTWESQPFINNIPAGNIMLSASILFLDLFLNRHYVCFKFWGVLQFPEEHISTISRSF